MKHLILDLLVLYWRPTPSSDVQDHSASTRWRQRWIPNGNLKLDRFMLQGSRGQRAKGKGSSALCSWTYATLKRTRELRPPAAVTSQLHKSAQNSKELHDARLCLYKGEVLFPFTLPVQWVLAVRRCDYQSISCILTRLPSWEVQMTMKVNSISNSMTPHTFNQWVKGV